MRRLKIALLGALALTVGLTGAAAAHEITSRRDPAKPTAFDITRAEATTDGRLATFIMEVTGSAGSVRPQPVGRLPGARA